MTGGVPVGGHASGDWPRRDRLPILAIMQFFARLSPLRAYQDLRVFLAQRQPYELGFLVLAMTITAILVWAFVKDSYREPVYKPDIIYVEQWTLNRTDAEIRAAQIVDQAKKEKRLAEEKAFNDKKRAQFKKLDDQMTKWGL